jgi:hypothetical protein
MSSRPWAREHGALPEQCPTKVLVLNQQLSDDRAQRVILLGQLLPVLIQGIVRMLDAAEVDLRVPDHRCILTLGLF